jgi:S-adenosylmethionine:tRNA-ribosyltransferase-isomerase (queuine synthetase)
MIIPNDIREFIKEKKEEKKIFLPVGTTMIRYLESLPYIRKYLRNINYLKDINSEVIKRWDTLTETITINKVNEFIPEQEIQTTND